MKTFFAVLAVSCGIFLFSLSSDAETVLVFDQTAVDDTFLPHTIVFPDCQSVPLMTVLSSCVQTTEDQVVYSPIPGTCENYSETMSAYFPDADAAIQYQLEEAPLVFYDTSMETAAPFDLSVAAACAGFGTYSEGGGGSGSGGGGSQDACPDDPNKTEPGVCGCGVADIDSDGDNILDCRDTFPDVPIAKGDMNNDGAVDLIDAISVMQVMVHLQPASTQFKQGDVDGDDKIGLSDLIYIFQSTVRQGP